MGIAVQKKIGRVLCDFLFSGTWELHGWQSFSVFFLYGGTVPAIQTFTPFPHPCASLPQVAQIPRTGPFPGHPPILSASKVRIKSASREGNMA